MHIWAKGLLATLVISCTGLKGSGTSGTENRDASQHDGPDSEIQLDAGVDTIPPSGEAGSVPLVICEASTVRCNGVQVATCNSEGTAESLASCGANNACSNGECVPCLQGADCAPDGNRCRFGKISCTNGEPICEDFGGKPAGATCGPALSCEEGSCVPREWITQWGTDSWDYVSDMAVDKNGDSFVVGETGGTFAGETKSGRGNAFVSKINAAGEVVWTRQWGSATGATAAWAVAVDGTGNVFVGGRTFGTLATDNAGGFDVFLRKFTAEGNVAWTKQWGTPVYDVITAVRVDVDGNVLAAGNTEGAIVEGKHAGQSDPFISKFSPSGQPMWTIQWGTPSHEWVGSLALDKQGRYYAFGSASMGSEGNLFLRKINTDGSLEWARDWGSKDESAGGIAVEDNGNILVSGTTVGNLQAPGSHAGGGDVFAAKFSSNGTPVWTRQWGTAVNDSAGGITVDHDGNAYVSSSTDAGVTSMGIHLRKLGVDGTLAWTRRLGPSTSATAEQPALAPGQTILVGGYTSESLSGQSFGDVDAYLIKVRD
jgi:hypothetical protein